MPSKSFNKFENNLLVDVQRIIDSHGQLNHNGGGRRGLGHLTRSGILMLCAAWELYMEEVLVEGVKYTIGKIDEPGSLPLPVQKELSRYVKESSHELKPLELAGEGWKTLYLNNTNEKIQSLNSPKSGVLDPMYKKFLGVDTISDCWSLGSAHINQFVSIRGRIAHKGRDARYITINQLKIYKDEIKQTALDVDNSLTEHLCAITPGIVRPWNRRLV